MAENPNNHGKPWTKEHLKLLLQLSRMGAAPEVMARRLGRTERATRNQLTALERCASVAAGSEPGAKKKKRPESWLSLPEVLEHFEVTERELLEACLNDVLRVLPADDEGDDSKHFSLLELRALYDEKGPMEIADKKSKRVWVKRAKKAVSDGVKIVGGFTAAKIADKVGDPAISEAWAYLLEVAQEFTRSADSAKKRPIRPRGQGGWLQTGELQSGYLSGEVRPRIMEIPHRWPAHPSSLAPHLADREMRPGRDYQTR